jgi:hypothetical protein
MKLIVQQNYTSGHGDAIMAMVDYMNVVSDLKKMGYHCVLQFSLARNFYFKNKTPLDYFDISSFSMFDEIKVTEDPFTETHVNGYTCVFTHAGAKPAAHYWDLFVDDDSVSFFQQNYKIKQYSMGSLVSGDVPFYKPILKTEILNIHNNFISENKIDEFSAIHFRTQDLQEEVDFLESKKSIINKIIDSEKNVFVCSNSSEFKKYIRSMERKNVFYWELPLENEIGGNHLEHYKLEDETLHQRCFFTYLDMWTLGCANRIFMFTTWGRHSNFLAYGALNKSEIISN